MGQCDDGSTPPEDSEKTRVARIPIFLDPLAENVERALGHIKALEREIESRKLVRAIKKELIAMKKAFRERSDRAMEMVNPEACRDKGGPFDGLPQRPDDGTTLIFNSTEGFQAA
ncbi:MAG: hypothetical protein AAB594_02535 [Patescibacteria group bacterium]